MSEFQDILSREKRIIFARARQKLSYNGAAHTVRYYKNSIVMGDVETGKAKTGEIAGDAIIIAKGVWLEDNHHQSEF